MMSVADLAEAHIPDFIVYCKKHRAEIDDSFLYDADLADFTPNEANPTYVLLNEKGAIVGAVSLLMDDHYRRSKRGRFRIFHCESHDIKDYQLLLNAIKKNAEGLDELSLFIQTTDTALIKSVENLGFLKWRYSFLLVNNDLQPVPVDLPEGFTVRPFRPRQDEAIWAAVRNAGFAKLLGSETPVTLDMVAKMVTQRDYLEDGMLVLYHGDRAVGIVRGANDEYDDTPIMNIGPLAIIPEYQRQGLGRALLRFSINFARKNAYSRAILCVNGENERAQSLYLSEGFKQVEAVVCFTYSLIGS